MLCIRIGFNADPDPAFFINADPDPGCWWPKIYSWKNVYFFDRQLQQQKYSSPKREQPPLKNLKFLHFWWKFLPHFSGSAFPMWIRNQPSRPKWMRIQIHNTSGRYESFWFYNLLVFHIGVPVLVYGTGRFEDIAHRWQIILLALWMFLEDDMDGSLLAEKLSCVDCFWV